GAMLPYWFMFLLAVGGMLVFGKRKGGSEKVAWWVVCSIFALMIGLRDQVGGDWYNYLGHFHRVARLSFASAVDFSDPGYYSLSWFVSHWGGDIYWLNTVCGVFVMVGVGLFCRAQPLPWLALSVAVPYMLVVVAMGY